MKTTISSKGQMVLPADLRARDDVRPGQQFEIERINAGQYLFRRIVGMENDGLVDWLLSCPERDWFQPIPSESTDDL